MAVSLPLIDKCRMLNLRSRCDLTPKMTSSLFNRQLQSLALGSYRVALLYKQLLAQFPRLKPPNAYYLQNLLSHITGSISSDRDDQTSLG